VVSTIERTEKGAECPKFAPPRLPAPQSSDFQSSTNKKPIASPFHDPFAFKKPPSPTLKNNQDTSPHLDHDRTTPFAFNHTVSNSSSVPIQIKAFSHSSQDTFAFSSHSTSLHHNVVTSHLQQQFHTDPSSSQFFNPFFFGTNSNLSNNTALASASHKQRSLLTDSSPSLINPATVVCNLPIPCSPPNATSSSPCRQPTPGRAINHNMLRRLSIMGAFASSSRSTYGAGILRFNQFCDRWAIPESDRMPASYALLCAFIAEHKGSFAGGTIKSWLSGIRAFHLVNSSPTRQRTALGNT
jgi:hypothetical protein